jgi:EmrB/QacA subfamily drug resistance transporter
VGEAGRPAGVPRPLALLVAGAFFMEMLDGTIIATAAPSIARSFGVRSADIGIAITAYLVTVAIFIPLSRWLADRLGARRLFFLAVLVFTIASALCAASTGLTMLTLTRVLQGIGGAMMVPVGRLVVLNSIDRRDLVRAIAYLTWPALAAPVVAPALGGLITTYLSWHWIFLVNVPLGALALVLIGRIVPRVPATAAGRLDVVGFVLAAAFLACAMLDASVLSRAAIPVALVAVLTAGAVAGGVLAVRHLLRRPEPLLDLSVFRVPTFEVAEISGGLFRSGVNALPFLLPLFFQDAFGWSPVRAGIAVGFGFVGNLAIKPATTSMLRRLGFRGTLLLAGLAAAVAVLGCAVLQPGWPFPVVAAAVLLTGVFRSIGFTGYNTVTLAEVDEARWGTRTRCTPRCSSSRSGSGSRPARSACGSVRRRSGWGRPRPARTGSRSC